MHYKKTHELPQCTRTYGQPGSLFQAPVLPTTNAVPGGWPFQFEDAMTTHFTMETSDPPPTIRSGGAIMVSPQAHTNVHRNRHDCFNLAVLYQTQAFAQSSHTNTDTCLNTSILLWGYKKLYWVLILQTRGTLLDNQSFGRDYLQRLWTCTQEFLSCRKHSGVRLPRTQHTEKFNELWCTKVTDWQLCTVAVAYAVNLSIVVNPWDWTDWLQ